MDTQTFDDKNENINIKKILFKVFANWRWFLISLTLTITFAVFYFNYKTKIYSVSTSLLINQEKPILDVGRLALISGESTVENEINKLSSTTIVNATLSRLNFGISYFQIKGFTRTELFDDCPFIIIPDTSKNQPLNVLFEVNVLNDSLLQIVGNESNYSLYNLKTENYIADTEIDPFKDPLIINTYYQNKILAFVLFLKPEIKNLSGFIGNKYEIKYESKRGLVSKYKDLSISNTKLSSIINISIKGNNPNKIAMFLNTFTEVYLEKSMEKKLTSASNTIDFIEKQLNEIADSLKISEHQLQAFKSTRKLMDIESESSRVFQKLEKLQTLEAQAIMKVKYYEYLKSYIESKESNNKELIAPASVGIDDPLMNNLLTELIGALNERNELALVSKKENPYIVSQDQKIFSIRKVLAENIKNVINAERLNLKEIESQIDRLSEQAGALPKTQRDLFNFERKYKVVDELYTFLLTKRSEIQIAKSSILPENEIIDKADPSYAILISPKRDQSLIIAILLGLGIPLLILLMLDFFNNKVQDLKEIESITGFNLLGKVVHNENKKINSIVEEPDSFLAEDFRFIRTNFQFITPDKEKQTILITSSLMNEGKSFVSLNLGLSFSLNNKKTVFVNFDLRKPLLNVPFNCQNINGLSNYLSRKCELNDIFCKSPYENMDIILPGPVPPNSSELISTARCELLFEYLKSKYDIIIVDTPPVGIIPDALLLVKYSDINLFVVRHNHTDKNILSDVSGTIVKRNINNFYLIVNDIDIQREDYYSYGYKYNYSYNYNHYKKKKKGRFQKLFSFKS